MKTSDLLAILTGPLCLASIAGAQIDRQPITQKNDPPRSFLQSSCTHGAGTNLCIPLDNTFQVVTFDGVGGNGPANPNDPCQRNDDDVTLAVNLPFTFDLFGTSWNQVFINNNGNISFGASFSTFTSTGFPVNGFPMVAPFWADVDTRNTASGVVYLKVSATHMTVIWDEVGYYNSHSDLKDTFEVTISDGNDPLLGLGNNVCFCYGDMQWTTGDASGGVGGFGGTPSTVGVNKGDGVNYFQIGRFGVPGNAYDGPGGNTDGVDYLDFTSYCFFVGQQGNNVAPVFLNPPTTCLSAHVGAPLNFNIQAIGPENNQTVTITVNTGGLANFTHNETPGNPATSACSFTPDCSQIGQAQITYTATDNYNPPASSQITVCIDVTSALEYCFGDGSANGGPDCPCGNSTPNNPNGCLHSLGYGAHLAANGCPSIGGDTLQLVASNLVPGKPTFFFAATAQSGGGLGVPYGDGLACIAGTRRRIGKVQTTPLSGVINVPLPGDAPLSVQFPPTIGQTHNYQAFFRNQAGPCGLGMNTTNGVSVVWIQ